MPAYLADVREGKPISPGAVEALVERYRRIGGRSPLDDATEAQRAALERELGAPVFVGMKHSRPRIADAVEQALAARRRDDRRDRAGAALLGLSVEGYRERLDDALADRAELRFVESWHVHEPYLDVLAERVRGETDAHVVFTAHSLPARILDSGDPYRDQLLETSRLVAERAGLERWSFAFQSASATGEPWLGPDILEELDSLAASRRRACPRLPDRLRLRPPRDPLGHRHRGARASGRARARARADPVAERRSRLHPRARRAVTGGRWSTLDAMKPGEILLENVGRRFRVYPKRNVTLKEAIVRRRDLKPTDIWALRDVSLHVEPGESIGFVGRNGSGKTTLMRLIAGHLRPDDGPCRGRRLRRFAARARRRLPPRLHRPRERLPERIDLRAQAARDRRAARRDRRVRGARSASSTSPCAPTRPGCRCGSASRSPSTSRPKCSCSTRSSPSETRPSSASASSKIIEFTGQGGTLCFVSHVASAVEHFATGPCCSGTAGSSTTVRRTRR